MMYSASPTITAITIKLENMGIAITPNVARSQRSRTIAAIVLKGVGRRSISQMMRRNISISQSVMKRGPKGNKGNLKSSIGPYPKNQSSIKTISIVVNIT